jgi:hypothetical protein
VRLVVVLPVAHLDGNRLGDSLSLSLSFSLCAFRATDERVRLVFDTQTAIVFCAESGSRHAQTRTTSFTATSNKVHRLERAGQSAADHLDSVALQFVDQTLLVCCVTQPEMLDIFGACSN